MENFNEWVEWMTRNPELAEKNYPDLMLGLTKKIKNSEPFFTALIIQRLPEHFSKWKTEVDQHFGIKRKKIIQGYINLINSVLTEYEYPNEIEQRAFASVKNELIEQLEYWKTQLKALPTQQLDGPQQLKKALTVLFDFKYEILLKNYLSANRLAKEVDFIDYILENQASHMKDIKPKIDFFFDDKIESDEEYKNNVLRDEYWYFVEYEMYLKNKKDTILLDEQTERKIEQETTTFKNNFDVLAPLSAVPPQSNLTVTLPKKVTTKHFAFTYSKPTASFQRNITAFRKDLIDTGFIDKSTKLADFNKIFKNELPDTLIKWSGNLSELYYLIKTLHNDKKLIENTGKEVWKITANCFIQKDGSPYDWAKFRGQKVPASSKKLDKIISNL